MRKTIRIILVLIVVAAVGVFVATLVHALWYAPESSIYVPEKIIAPSHTPLPEEQPERLIIPKLEIDADVQYVGVTAAGAMGVPNNFSDVAWYKYGTAPGFEGSAVIDGHLDNGLGLAAVFKRLGELKAGDDVYVRQKGGTTLHFVVRSVEQYDRTDVPVEDIFNRTGGAYLNLITCEGRWIRTDKTYDQRLVVYTELAA